jgi:hypothetical protein
VRPSGTRAFAGLNRGLCVNTTAIGLATLVAAVIVQPVIQQATKHYEAQRVAARCWDPHTQAQVTGMLKDEAVQQLFAAIHRDVPNSKLTAEEVGKGVSARATLVAVNSVNLDTSSAECEANFDLRVFDKSSELHAPFSLYQTPDGVMPLLRVLAVRTAITSAINDIGDRAGWSK